MSPKATRITLWILLLLSLNGISWGAPVEPVIPLVDLEVTTPIPEGSPTIATVTVTNPDTTRNLTISEIVIALSGKKPDLTDTLTLTGARVNFAGCSGVAVRGILAGTGNLTLIPGLSCFDNIVIPSLDSTVPDEGPPDSGTTVVNASAITPDGVHSIIQAEDVIVEDVPEPGLLVVLGAGIIGLARFVKLLD